MRVLFFTPHMAIWQHSVPEMKIAKFLLNQGCEVDVIVCDSILNNHCACMSANGVRATADTLQKAQICTICRTNRDAIALKYKLTTWKIEDLLSEIEKSEIDNLLAAITPENYLDFYYSDIPIGKLATYEVLLTFKKNNFTFEGEQWREYQASFKNSLLSIFAVAAYLRKRSADRLLIYNTLYGINHSILELAKKFKIPTYTLHTGENIYDRLSTMLIAKGHNFDYRVHLRNSWPLFAKQCISKAAIQYIGKHFKALFEGTNHLVYSAPSNEAGLTLRNRFNISPNQKILLATLSSPDELFAAIAIGVLPSVEKSLYLKQSAWIQALIKFIANEHELFLVIRVHPREFPNKRENVTSANGIELMQMLQNLPTNVIVDWPQNQISIYHWAREIDVVLNAWSGVGEEMSLLGIPVVIYDTQLPQYPADLNYVGTTEEAYFSQIRQALKDGWQEKISIMAFRWYAMRFIHGVFRISKYSYPELMPSKPVTFWSRVRKFALSRARRLLQLPVGNPEPAAARAAREMRFDAKNSEIANFLSSGLETRCQFLTLTQRKDLSSPEEEIQNIKATLTMLANQLFANVSADQRKGNRLFNNLTGFGSSFQKK